MLPRELHEDYRKERVHLKISKKFKDVKEPKQELISPYSR
jgi:hypothetical protein